MNSQAGFTLIETMIALIILAIGFTILVDGFVIISSTVEKKQDYIFLNGWTGERLMAFVSRIDVSRNGQVSYQNKDYNWWINEKYITDKLKEIELNVEWPGREGIKHYKISRLIYRGGRSDE